MRNTTIVLLIASLALIAGCQSSEKGVKTNYLEQWTDVAANTQTTTEAAKAVFTEDNLRDVEARSTNLDGMATGRKADGTKITASIKKLGDASSQVTVNVGTMGDPKIGADIARRIKDRAERK